jgi:outer membrane protein assembly factor BamE
MAIIRQKTGLRQARGILMLALGLLTTACVYRMPIQQGNYLDPAAIAQIKSGMTRSQVRYLLGTPMVPGAFDNARWDYDFYLKTRHLQVAERGHVVVYFSKDLVAHVDSNVKYAPFAPGAAQGLTAMRIF